MSYKGYTKLTPEEFDAKIDEFINYCSSTNTPPLNYWMRKVVGVTEATVTNYRNRANELAADDVSEDAQKYRALLETVKKLDEFRTAFWQNVAFQNPKLQAFAMFNLKQPWNGGYTDKPAGSSGAQVEVTIKQTGIGGDDAFK